MSSKKPKATRKRMISCFAQIVQEHIPGWKIEEIVDVSKIYAAGVLRADGGENHHTRLKTASLRRQKFRASRTEP